MPYYIEDPVSKYTCIGNSLSSLQISLSSLDTALYDLSSFVGTINFPSTVAAPLVSMTDPRGTVGSRCYDSVALKMYEKIAMDVWIGWDVYTTL